MSIDYFVLSPDRNRVELTDETEKVVKVRESFITEQDLLIIIILIHY